MDRTTLLDSSSSTVGLAVPSSRTVRSLDAALQLLRRLGGSVTSEKRTAPGIGSWALVVDTEGNELVLWENAALA